jgi:hypothetical protein
LSFAAASTASISLWNGFMAVPPSERAVQEASGELYRLGVTANVGRPRGKICRCHGAPAIMDDGLLQRGSGSLQLFEQQDPAC